MSAEHSGEEVVARIGFAERWLERAKDQVVEGNLTRGILTLVLAGAEVHHALEEAGARPHRSRILRSALVPAAAAIALLIGLSVMVWPAEDRSDDAALRDAPPIVSLSPRVGSLLELLSPVSPASPTVAAPRTTLRAAVREVAAPSAPVLRPRAIQPAAVHRKASAQTSVQLSTAQPAAPVMPPAPTIQAVQPGVTQLSSGDLIDLVLAAERALRDPTPPP
ncbi:MAG: hypothetical protein ACRDFA_13005 [bacterium]